VRAKLKRKGEKGLPSKVCEVRYEERIQGNEGDRS